MVKSRLEVSGTTSPTPKVHREENQAHEVHEQLPNNRVFCILSVAGVLTSQIWYYYMVNHTL